MLDLIRRSWIIVLSPIAGPAFIVAGLLMAIFASLSALYAANTPGVTSFIGMVGFFSDPTNVFLSFGPGVAIDLVLLVGLTATYARWATALDLLGKLGIWVAAIGFAVSSLADTVFMLTFAQAIEGYNSDSLSSLVGLLSMANTAASYASWIGMMLTGVFVMRTKASILPSWARSLPLIIGLWRPFTRIMSGIIIPKIFPVKITQTPEPGPLVDPWSLGLTFILSIVWSILWVLLGKALLGFPLKSGDQAGAPISSVTLSERRRETS